MILSYYGYDYLEELLLQLSGWNYGMWYFRELHMGYGGYREGRNACKEGERIRTQSRRLLLEIAKELKQEIGKSTRTSKAMRTSNI